MKPVTKTRLDRYAHGDLDAVVEKQKAESVEFFTELLSKPLLPGETDADAVKRIRKEIGESPRELEG